MRFQTYTATPGLERYPKRERLRVWQAAHKQLLHDDVPYRKRFHSYLVTIICLSCAMLPFYLTFAGVRLFGVVIDISLILFMAGVIVYLAVRQMKFMNEKVGQYLQSSRGS